MALRSFNLTPLKMTPRLGSAVLGVAILVVAIKLLLRTLIIVPTGEVGVIENPDKILTYPLMPGVYWLKPWDNVVKISTRVQTQNETLELTSREGINFTVDVGLEYRINPQKSGNFYQVIGGNSKKILREKLAAVLSLIASQYPLKVIYGNQNEAIAKALWGSCLIVYNRLHYFSGDNSYVSLF